MARRLLLLNGLATLGVVLNHGSSWVFIGMFWWTHRYRDVSVPNFDELGSVAYYVLRAVEQLVAFTVPSFLFVSGFFIAFVSGREALSSRWTHSEKRLRTLLVPYLIWSTLLLLERYISGIRYTPISYLKIYLTGRAADPYYYIPLLCQCLVLAPLLIECARRNWKLLVCFVAVVQLTVQGLRYPLYLGWDSPTLEALAAVTPGWFFPGKIFWFVFGLVAALHMEDMHRRVVTYRWHFLALAAALLPLGMVEWEVLRQNAPTQWIPYYDTALDSVYAAVVITTMLGFTAEPPLTQSIQEVGKQSYGVYLVHSIVLMYSARLVYKVAPGLLEHALVFFIVLVVIGLGVPLLAMYVVRTSGMRSVYRYVFG